MRVGDSYKIKNMILTANASDEDVLQRFKNDYSAEEIQRFIDMFKPKPAKKKAAVKKDDGQ